VDDLSLNESNLVSNKAQVRTICNGKAGEDPPSAKTSNYELIGISMYVRGEKVKKLKGIK
jgi:hypothetical protein